MRCNYESEEQGRGHWNEMKYQDSNKRGHNPLKNTYFHTGGLYQAQFFYWVQMKSQIVASEEAGKLKP